MRSCLKGMISVHKARTSRGDRVFNVCSYILSAIIMLSILYPLFFIIIASFSDPTAIQRGEVLFWPVGSTTAAYTEIFANAKIWRSYLNTIIYTVTTTATALICVLPCAYTLSRKDYPLRNIVMAFFLIAMYFNGGMIPTYMVVKRLGLLNTMWSVVLTSTVSVFNIIIARTFFQTTIPDAVRDAAVIDGCSDFRFFFQIVLPLSKAIIAVIGLYTAVAAWNGYMSAMMYLTKDELHPLQLVLRNILIENQFDFENSVENLKRSERLKYALIVVSTVPIMCAYPFIQKYFAQGVMIGAVKG